MSAVQTCSTCQAQYTGGSHTCPPGTAKNTVLDQVTRKGGGRK